MLMDLLELEMVHLFYKIAHLHGFLRVQYVLVGTEWLVPNGPMLHS